MAPGKNPRDLLTPAALHILLSVASERLHGYAIKRAVEARTEGALSLGPGTLYEAIHRMANSGWIEEVGGEEGKKSLILGRLAAWVTGHPAIIHLNDTYPVAPWVSFFIRRLAPWTARAIAISEVVRDR